MPLKVSVFMQVLNVILNSIPAAAGRFCRIIDGHSAILAGKNKGEMHGTSRPCVVNLIAR
jgi:hypothetical protein